MVCQAVEIYNNQRLHFSLELQTPENVHQIENVKYKSYKLKKILNLTQQNNWKMCQLFQDNTQTRCQKEFPNEIQHWIRNETY